MIEPFSEPCDLEERDRTRLIYQILESKGVLVFNTSGSRNSRGLSDLDLIDRYFNIAYRSNGQLDSHDVSESLLDGPCMNAHPVIHLNLNDVHVGDKELFLKGIRTRISNTCVEHRDLLESKRQDTDDVNLLRELMLCSSNDGVLQDSLLILSRMLSTEYDADVVVLIDGYNSISINDDCSKDHEITDFMQGMMYSCFQGNHYCCFGVISGTIDVTDELYSIARVLE